MHVALACGGTGGHAFPGMVTGQVLRQRGHTITLWVAGRDAEAGVLKGWDGPIVRLVARGFETGWTAGGLGIAIGHLRAARQASAHMRGARPDVLLGMGSYSSVPPVLAAARWRVPIVLHEANAVPGRAVSLLSRLARGVGITFPSAAGHLRHARTVLTGLPMRTFTGAAFRGPPLIDGVFTILVMGGSQGAHVLNETVPGVLGELHRGGRALQVIHLTGPADEASVRAAYAAAGIPHRVHGFLGEVECAYRRANLAICRSGAGTCMELALCGVPAILVPLPTARRDHQRHNAEALVRGRGARLLPQADLTAARLAVEIAQLMEAPAELAAMRAALNGMAISNGAERLADLVEAIAKGV